MMNSMARGSSGLEGVRVIRISLAVDGMGTLPGLLTVCLVHKCPSPVMGLARSLNSLGDHVNIHLFLRSGPEVP